MFPVLGQLPWGGGRSLPPTTTPPVPARAAPARPYARVPLPPARRSHVAWWTHLAQEKYQNVRTHDDMRALVREAEKIRDTVEEWAGVNAVPGTYEYDTHKRDLYLQLVCYITNENNILRGRRHSTDPKRGRSVLLKWLAKENPHLRACKRARKHCGTSPAAVTRSRRATQMVKEEPGTRLAV